MLLFLDGLFAFLDNLHFIVQIITWCYLLFWLYMTFRDMPVMFGLTSLIASYFIFAHSLSTSFLVLVFFAFMLMGTQLQMLLQFGVYPILGFLGIKPPNPFEPQMMGHEERQSAIQKALKGQEMSQQESQMLYQEMQAQMQQQSMQEAEQYVGAERKKMQQEQSNWEQEMYMRHG
jgi:hypothetical protein